MPEYPYIPPLNTPVWIANYDGTTDRRWIDGYDPANDLLYLRSIQNSKKWNNGARVYDAKELGKTIFYSYPEAQRTANRMSRERLEKMKTLRMEAAQ